MNNLDERTRDFEFFAHDKKSEDELQLLFLMPLVQTAWAHGAIALREKHLIFEAAREDGIDGRSQLNDRLSELFLYQPSRKFFSDSLDKISSLLQSMTVREREQLAAKIYKRCRSVAESAGGNSAMDVSAFISPEEQQTLSEIGEALGIRQPDDRKGIFGPASRNAFK